MMSGFPMFGPDQPKPAFASYAVQPTFIQVWPSTTSGSALGSPAGILEVDPVVAALPAGRGARREHRAAVHLPFDAQPELVPEMLQRGRVACPRRRRRGHARRALVAAGRLVGGLRHRVASELQEVLEVLFALAKELPADAAHELAVLRRIEQEPVAVHACPLGPRVLVRIRTPAGDGVIRKALDAVLPRGEERDA